MGFGFVEYRKPEQAQKALKQLQVSGRSQPRSAGAQAGGAVSRQSSEIEWECRAAHIFPGPLLSPVP